MRFNYKKMRKNDGTKHFLPNGFIAFCVPHDDFDKMVCYNNPDDKPKWVCKDYVLKNKKKGGK